ncbi:MAG: hypothetical protein KDA85_08725, partial [Planctomycetaceae bacterium]|nr:hypothetical protein [Planctomycetaceae bacterium]
NQGRERPKSDNGKAAIAEWELYDLVDDPAETMNLSDRFPDEVSAMKQRLQAWISSCAASDRGADY